MRSSVNLIFAQQIRSLACFKCVFSESESTQRANTAAATALLSLFSAAVVGVFVYFGSNNSIGNERQSQFCLAACGDACSQLLESNPRVLPKFKSLPIK